MTTNDNPLLGAYLEKGTIGDVGMLGAPILSFALVVVPGQHKVSGTAQVKADDMNRCWSGQVTGTIFSRPSPNGDTSVITFQGRFNNDGTMPIQIEGWVYMDVDAAGNGTGGFDIGGFDIGNDHVAHARLYNLPQ